MSNKTLSDVLTSIKAAIVNNSTINAWCQTNFGKNPTIYIGVDSRQPPEMAECPLIMIGTGPRRRDNEQNFYQYIINVGCQIETEQKQESSQTIEYTGLTLIDDFAVLVERQISARFNLDHIASTQEPVFEDENAYPFFKAIWTYSIRIQNLLR